MAETSIPFDVAVDFCNKYKEEHKVRLFSQCWGCVRFSKSNPEKMCFYKPPSNDGCKFVNQLYEKARMSEKVTAPFSVSGGINFER